MSIDTKMAERVRKLLIAVTDDVEEKTMFGSLAFMVNGKLCIGVKSDQILVRVGPEEFARTVESGELQPMKMGSRTSSSFGYISAELVQTTKELQRWVNWAMEYNSQVPDKPGRSQKGKRGK